jgi:hypothetical protein
MGDCAGDRPVAMAEFAGNSREGQPGSRTTLGCR